MGVGVYVCVCVYGCVHMCMYMHVLCAVCTYACICIYVCRNIVIGMFTISNNTATFPNRWLPCGGDCFAQQGGA